MTAFVGETAWITGASSGIGAARGPGPRLGERGRCRHGVGRDRQFGATGA